MSRDIDWEKEFEEYSKRRKQRLSKNRHDEKKELKLSGGSRLPHRLRYNIYDFINDDCQYITNQGKRCSKAFNYINSRGNKKSCIDFCLKNCKKWISDIIDNLPVYLYLNDIDFNIYVIDFIVSKTEYSNDFVYSYYYEDKSWRYEHKSISKDDIKEQLCKRMRNMESGEYFFVDITCIAKMGYRDNYHTFIRKYEHRYLDLPFQCTLLNVNKERWFSPGWKIYKFGFERNNKTGKRLISTTIRKTYKLT